MSWQSLSATAAMAAYQLTSLTVGKAGKQGAGGGEIPYCRCPRPWTILAIVIIIANQPTRGRDNSVASPLVLLPVFCC